MPILTPTDRESIRNFWGELKHSVGVVFFAFLLLFGVGIFGLFLYSIGYCIYSLIQMLI